MDDGNRKSHTLYYIIIKLAMISSFSLVMYDYFVRMKQIINWSIFVFLVIFSGAAFSRNHFFVEDTAHSTLQFVFCSDVHFGINRASFRGKTDVTAAEVNAAMMEQMNMLPSNILPNDGGVFSGKKIGGINALIITGDICNRMEKGVQSATVSWGEFEKVYITNNHLLDNDGHKTKLLLTPGNHDISDAVGFEKPMQPLVDNASMLGIYNLMMHPTVAKNTTTYNHKTDKVHYSVDMGKIHLVFVDAWPDSSERVWMEKDLKNVTPTTPVLLFAHSMPDVEARFFTNPNGNHSINENDRFENLVDEVFKDGPSVKGDAIIEQKGFVQFLQIHPNIKAYFHGHNNHTEFYNWRGPDQNIDLPVFRVDSPMKGKSSSKDETMLSFELVSIDTKTNKMTVRECLWNAQPNNVSPKVGWGISKSFQL